MNDVTRDNYDKIYPKIKKALENASFISVDAEFTGLHSNVLQSSLFDSIEERYSTIRKTIQPFVVIQFGISAFKHVRDKNKYTAEPFQFFLLPRSVPIKNRLFSWQVAALEFLTKHNFDFNKVVYNGINYIDQNEETLLRKQLQDKTLFTTIHQNASYEIVEELRMHCNNVQLWLEETSKNDEIFTIEVSLLELKYLLHKELRARFLNIWTIDGQNMVNVIKVSKEMHDVLQEENNNIEDIILDSYIGFSKVFKLLVELKKPIIGHNIFLDLMFMYKLFYQPLPKKYKEFKSSLNNIFPLIYDTKYLSYQYKLVLEKDEKWNVNNLQNLYFYFKNGKGRYPAVNIPIIELNQEINSTNREFHHAGWDAYFTGYIFIKMACKFTIDKYKLDSCNKQLTHTEMMSALKPHLNRINVSRASLQHIKLDGPDPLSKQAPWLHVKTLIPTALDLSQLTKQLSTFGLVDVKPFTSRRAIVAVSNYGSAQNILNHFRNSKELYVTPYSPIRHSPTIRLAIWSSALLSGGGMLAWLLHRSMQKSG